MYNKNIINIYPKLKKGGIPLVGRGMGPCGRGYIYHRRPRSGYRRGYGRGICGYYGPVDKKMMKAFMEEEKAFLEKRLKGINENLEKLDEEED